MKRRKGWGSVNLLINLGFFLSLVVMVNVTIPSRFGVWNTTGLVMAGIMLVASLLHHSAVILEDLGVKRFKVPAIHGPISHLLFFVPFGLMSITNGLQFCVK